MHGQATEFVTDRRYVHHTQALAARGPELPRPDSRPARMTRALVASLIALLAVAGCSLFAGSLPAPAESPEPAVPIACFGLEEPDCTAALEAAATKVKPGDVVVYAEVGPFGCAAGEGCANTLAARPQGVAVLELANGDPLNMGMNVAPDGTITVVPDTFSFVAVPPSSVAGQLANGPVPYSLGHCGLSSGIDVDGSWWDPIGFVDADHPALVNAADGTFTPHDANHATFTADGGFEVTLARRVGEKHLPMCM